MELAQSQKIRLQESCVHLQCKVSETEKTLTEERECNTMSLKSAEKHNAILAKVEQLNLSDSKKLLRKQKNKLEQQLEISMSRMRELEAEAQPLKENMKVLTVQKDALVAVKTVLKNEVAKWNTHTTQLIERYNQVDPDEYKQLMEERETRKQEVIELKAQVESLRSELSSEQEAKQKLESEISSVNTARELEKTTTEGKITELQGELAKSEEELAKTSETLKGKNVVVQKLQKVGRSYRMKFEEATKELEELKEATQSKEAATAAVSASQQSELEKKIKELEKENKEQKETVEAQKASIAASETKLAEMRRTMKIAMQRFTDMKSEREKLDREVRKIGEERATNEQQLEELTKKLDTQKMEYEERITSLEERLRHYHHSPKPEGRLTESTTASTQTLSTQTVTLATPMATVKPTASVKHSSSTRVSATPTASIRPLASTTQTPTAAVTPTLIVASNNSSQQQACVAPIAPVTTVTTESVTTMDTASASTLVSSVTMVTSGEVPTTTTAVVETSVTTTVNVVDPTTSLVMPEEGSNASHDSTALLQEPSEPQSSRESSVAPITQQDTQVLIQPAVTLKHAKPSTATTSGNLSGTAPSVSIVRMKHPGLSSVGTHTSRVIKRPRVEEEGATDQEGFSGDSKKLKQEVTTTEETSSGVVSAEDIAMSSTAEETTEEEQPTKEPTTDHKEEDNTAASSITSDTTNDTIRITITPVDNVPVSSHASKEPQQQQLETELITEENITSQETMEQTTSVEDQDEAGGDDDMVAISESAATSEVIVDDDDDGNEDIADEPEEETIEADEEEEEEECDEEADDEEDVDIEGFETAGGEQIMETDIGMSKSDPIELSSDEDTEHIPPVMLSSTVRDVCIKLEQPDDEESNIVLSMVDEINDASSSMVDVGSEVTGDIQDDARDEGGDVELVSHYDIPLLVPINDNLLPTTRDNAEMALSSNEPQPQAEVPRHVRPQTMVTRAQTASLHEVRSDQLVPHTPVYNDPALVTTLMGYSSVPVNEQPRLVGSQPNSSAQVAMVPSLESTSDILLTAIIGADQSARDEPALEPTPPTVTTEPSLTEDQSADHVSQQEDRVTTTTAAAPVVSQAHVSSRETWSPEEGELEDIAEEDTITVTIDSGDESSVKPVAKVSLVGESISAPDVKEATKESDQTSSEEGSSGRRLVGSSSGTQQSTVISLKSSASIEQSDQKASTKRKIQPVVWDKPSQSGSSSGSVATVSSGRGTKIKRGEPARRGRGTGRGGRKAGGTKK